MNPPVLTNPFKCSALSRLALPDDLVDERLKTEDFIKYGLRIVAYVRADVKVKAARGSKKFMEKDKRFVQPFKVRIQSFSPGISICLLLKNRRLLYKHRALVIGGIA